MEDARTSNTLVYAPQIQVLVATDSGVLDLSEDVVNGQVRRIVNGVSQFSCVINNRRKKYTGKLKRMDRITVSFARVGKWVQVFSGYLDSVPGITLYTSTASIRASCTLKRLMHTWWDPGLPESQALLDQRNFEKGTDGGTQQNGVESDTGIGKMLSNLLFKVGSWDLDQIKIQNIPAGFLNLALEMSVAQAKENASFINALRIAVGVPDAANPATGPNNVPNSYETNQPVTGFKAPASKSGEYDMGELVQIARGSGFTGDGLITAAVIAYFNSNGLPSMITGKQPAGFVGPQTVFAGLFGLRVGVSDPLKVDTSAAHTVGAAVLESEAKDPLTAGKILFDLTSKGTNFPSAANAQTFYPAAYNNRGTSNAWDTAIASAKAENAKNVSDLIIYGSPSTSLVASQTTGMGTVSTASYPTSASQSFLQGIYGNSQAAVEANLVSINFQGNSVKVNKLAAAAFQKVDAQITALNTGYKVKEIGTFEYRTMNNGTGTSTLSWHSYGIAIDINPSTNGFVDAGIGNGTHDLPDSWITVFKANGFAWGGDWGDFMHFQWQGGGTFTGVYNPDGSLAAGGDTGGGSTAGQYAVQDPFKENVFGYLFLGNQITNEATDLTGYKAPVNDVQLLSTVQAMASASMRSFMSGPDGSFIAFYPDYFGVNKTAPVLVIEDIEMINFSIDVSDDALTTDVFVAGGVATSWTPTVDANEWLNTAGVVNIKQPGVMSLLLGVDGVNDPDFAASAIYSRFGLRPLKAEYPQVSTGTMEYLQALSLFQKKWAEQYSTSVQFTFMPELYPGMRVLIKSYKITVYVEEVTHSFGFDTGFSTAATVSAPATVGGGITGMNLGRL